MRSASRCLAITNNSGPATGKLDDYRALPAGKFGSNRPLSTGKFGNNRGRSTSKLDDKRAHRTAEHYARKTPSIGHLRATFDTMLLFRLAERGHAYRVCCGNRGADPTR